jgi:hypothetical protein
MSASLPGRAKIGILTITSDKTAGLSNIAQCDVRSENPILIYSLQGPPAIGQDGIDPTLGFGRGICASLARAACAGAKLQRPTYDPRKRSSRNKAPWAAPPNVERVQRLPSKGFAGRLRLGGVEAERTM